MKRVEWLWLVFVVGTILCWGSYVPTIHEGQSQFGNGKPTGALRAFLCVGGAYFLTAVLVPAALLMFTNLEERTFNAAGTITATIAGIFGACGALGIILAIKTGGPAVVPYVPPLVFAGAPIVATLVTMAWHPPKTPPAPAFYVGLVMAASGAGLVLFSKPK